MYWQYYVKLLLSNTCCRDQWDVAVLFYLTFFFFYKVPLFVYLCLLFELLHGSLDTERGAL